MVFAGGLMALAMTSALLSVGRPPRIRAQAPPIIELVGDAVIHGPAVDSYLSVRGTADLDGDGVAEALVDWAKLSRGVQQDQQDLLIGRAVWPAESSLDGLDGVESLGLPFIGNDMASRDNASFYGFRTFLDANGDGWQDLAVFEQTRRASAVREEEVKIYFGGEGWRTPDITRVRGDLSITQDQVPAEPHLAERNPMPEQILAGDFDGDGIQDIAIASCHVERGREFEEGQTGTLRLYLSPEGGAQDINLRGGAADAVLTGEMGLAMGCFETFAGDFDGDGIDDVLISGSDLTEFGGSYAALLLGRLDWPGKAEIADLADVRFAHPVERGGVRATGARDLDGDGDLEVLFEYGVGHVVGGACAWLGSPEMPAVAVAADCPLRFVDEQVFAVADLDGDGARDLIFELPYRAGDEGPYRYVAMRGPITGDTVAIGEKTGSTLGDAVLDLSNEHRQAEWFVDDLNGDGLDDVLLARDAATNPDGDEFAGRIDILFGPVVDPELWPAPVTATPVPIATATSASTVTATPGVLPTASSSPSAPVPSTAIFLPAALRSAALGIGGN